MAGVPDLNKNAPGQRPTEEQPEVTDLGGAGSEHRRVERDAMDAAKRAKERMHEDEAGNDEFSNIGPV
ncbi:MAG: hypothetical protein WA708_21155 [Acidobacteriaceae bacterium]